MRTSGILMRIAAGAAILPLSAERMRADIVAIPPAAVGVVSNSLLEAQDLFTVTITLDELGVLRFQNSNGADQLVSGVLARDPGPGGLAFALQWPLGNPSDFIPGDLFIFESGNILTDIIRFNLVDAAHGGSPMIVFYSATDDSVRDLADTGFPTFPYANTTSVLAAGREVRYTPTANQPGFIGASGLASVTYVIQRDVAVAPEPSTIALTLTGLMAIGGVALRRRRDG